MSHGEKLNAVLRDLPRRLDEALTEALRSLRIQARPVEED